MWGREWEQGREGVADPRTGSDTPLSEPELPKGRWIFSPNEPNGWIGNPPLSHFLRNVPRLPPLRGRCRPVLVKFPR